MVIMSPSSGTIPSHLTVLLLIRLLPADFPVRLLLQKLLKVRELPFLTQDFVQRFLLNQFQARLEPLSIGSFLKATNPAKIAASLKMSNKIWRGLFPSIQPHRTAPP